VNKHDSSHDIAVAEFYGTLAFTFYKYYGRRMKIEIYFMVLH